MKLPTLFSYVLKQVKQDVRQVDYCTYYLYKDEVLSKVLYFCIYGYK